MEQDKLTAINRYIRDAAQQAADIGSISGPAIERFLRTGEETWDGAGSGRFTLAQIKQDEIYSERAKAALRTLFALLTNLLPLEAKRVPPVAPETIRQHVDPMVKGLVQPDWHGIALRELTRRTFVLTYHICFCLRGVFSCHFARRSQIADLVRRQDARGSLFFPTRLP